MQLVDARGAQVVIWASFLLGGLIDLYSLLLMLLRPPTAESGRPSPVFAVPVLLYLMGASVAAITNVQVPWGLVAGLVLVHLGVVLGVPKVLARVDSRRARRQAGS